jgi:capsular exopolysaccharide synthesis family protein
LLPSHDDDFSSPAGHRPEAAARNPLRVVWQRKSLVLLAGVVGLVAASIYYAQRPPVYQSKAQVLVIKKRTDPLQMANGEQRVTVVEDYVATQLIVICSPMIVERAVDKGRLRDLPSMAGVGDPVPVIVASLTALRDPKENSSNIINLTYKGPVAEDCGKILQAIIDAYQGFLTDTTRLVGQDTLNLISEARKQLEKDFKEKSKEYMAFREKVPVLAAPVAKDGTPVSQARLADLEARRLALLIRASELEERRDTIEGARADGMARELVQAMTAERPANAPPDVEAQLLPLRLQEQALLEDFGEEHPKVVDVRKKIRMTRELLTRGGPQAAAAAADPVEAYLKALDAELEVVKVATRALAELTAKEEQATRVLRSYEDQDDQFRTDIAQTRLLMNETMNRLKALSIAPDGSGVFSVHTLSHPGMGVRTGTGLGLVLVAGLALGLLLGVGLAYLADSADKSFRTPEEIRRRLGLPVLAHVPLLEEDGAPVEPDAPALERSLASYHRPMSAEAEAYRSARTALYFSTRDGTHKVIQVTSPNMGDGKSTIAANLAIAIAQSGKSVVLVDADLRRPRVGVLFGVAPGGAGLTSVIGGAEELGACLVPSGLDKLTLLTSGPLMANPAELLTLPHFAQVLDELRGRFDFVVVDTPPLLAVTDPCVVAARADGVLLVVRLGHKDRPAAERARETLSGLGANVLGVVVNGVGPDAGGYGYGYGSYEPGYGYGYGYPKEANGTPAQPAAAAANGHNGAARKHRKRRPAGWLTRLWR